MHLGHVFSLYSYSHLCNLVLFHLPRSVRLVHKFFFYAKALLPSSDHENVFLLSSNHENVLLSARSAQVASSFACSKLTVSAAASYCFLLSRLDRNNVPMSWHYCGQSLANTLHFLADDFFEGTMFRKWVLSSHLFLRRCNVPPPQFSACHHDVADAALA